MRHFILTTLLFISATVPTFAADTYFPYPQAPDEITELTARSNYIVNRFWDRCNFSTAFLSRDKMKQAFIDYINILPYAEVDTVRISIDNLINRVKKQPNDMLSLAQLAQETMYGPDAEFWSDDLYLPFAQAVASHKKISKNDKAPFQKHVKVLGNSKNGEPAPGINLTLRDGSTYNTDSLSTPISILFITSGDCSDCMLSRVKLAANVGVIRLIEEGKLKIALLDTTPYSTEWAESMSAIPQSWIVGTSPEVENILDVRSQPEIYILGSNHKILVKHAKMEHIIPLLESIQKQ